MKNIERQRKLDEQKWLNSEGMGYDRSGCMDWCMYCDMQKNEYNVYNKSFWRCDIPQVDREMNCVCARAYNRMVRDKQLKGAKK